MNAPPIHAPGRTARLDLRFRRTAAGRTILGRQFFQYPFHLTRPFHLDRARPKLATLFLQSSSGGLYEGDRLQMDVHVAAGAEVHLTTQASTIVHRGAGAAQTVSIELERDAFLAWLPDPAILFAGAGLEQRTHVRLAEGANLMICEGLLAHDPRAHHDGIRHWLNETVIERPDAEAVVDRQVLDGGNLAEALGPQAAHHALASFFLVGPAFGGDVLERLRAELEGVGLYAGAGPVPGGGLIVRVLAESGAALARASDTVFRIGFEAATGVPPEPRGK